MNKSRRDCRHYNWHCLANSSGKSSTEETVDIIIGTAWPTHPASLAYALDLRIYYIKNKVDDKCFTKNILFINYLPLFIKEKC